MEKRIIKSSEKGSYSRMVATNAKARHDYFIEESVEAGIELQGSEVKSLRTRQVSFADAYARVFDDECWLIGLHLTTYDKAHVQLPESTRRRRLLLNHREINKLRAKSELGGRTLIPLEIYFKGSWAKVRLGICRGKTFGDKRETLRTAEAKRDIERALKSRR
ncbi:MAG: SsrA-binding protein SmpB [Planctomycetota bacterium]